LLTLYKIKSGAKVPIFDVKYPAQVFLTAFSFDDLGSVIFYHEYVSIVLSKSDPMVDEKDSRKLLADADELTISTPDPFDATISVSFRHPWVKLPFNRPKSDASQALRYLKDCVRRRVPEDAGNEPSDG
jgi:hypothetical protein